MGGEKRGEKEGDTGGEKGEPGARMSPSNPPRPRTGSLRVATRERGRRGAGGLIGLTELIGLTHHEVTRRQPAK